MAQLHASMRAAVAALLLTTISCTSDDEQLRQHQRKLQSLAASATTIADGWLAGTLTSRFTRTALERTFDLIEQERGQLAGDPHQIAQPGPGELAEAATREARAVARLARDVAQNDRASFVHDADALRSSTRDHRPQR